MCGIAGICGAGGRDADANRVAVAAMSQWLIPRGPDDSGIEEVGNGVIFASRRLAIIDPSPAGHQPMVDPHRGNVVAFNGMIYNFRELRRELEGMGERFESNCDTEVLLRAYGVWGPDCVVRLEGMFAFAIWDAIERRVFLARDRLGIKPLYWARTAEGSIAFASQVKALIAGGLVPPDLDVDGIASYLSYGAVSDPLTAIRGVRALEPGHAAIWDGRAFTVNGYWAPPTPRVGPQPPVGPAEVRALLDDAVQSHLVSDAPLGVFLSGGLDSSAIAALAARHQARVRTVSVTFEEEGYSEAEFQTEVARQIGCEHIPVTFGLAELWRDSEKLFGAMDQPTFDGVNTYVVSRAAAESGLKVALSGLGADELLDGYGYVARVRALERLRLLPGAARRPAADVTARWPDSKGRKLTAWLRGELPRDAAYDLLRRLFLPAEVDRLLGRPSSVSPALAVPRGGRGHRTAALDLTNYMKNVLLRDTDAMSMGVSLEVRVPFLHDPLVHQLLNLPEHARSGGKRLLAEAVSDVVPASVVNRGKHGFLLPIAEWMRGDLSGEVRSRLHDLPVPLAEVLDSGSVKGVAQGFNRTGEGWLRPWSLYALIRWHDSLADCFAPVTPARAGSAGG